MRLAAEADAALRVQGLNTEFVALERVQALGLSERPGLRNRSGEGDIRAGPRGAAAAARGGYEDGNGNHHRCRKPLHHHDSPLI